MISGNVLIVDDEASLRRTLARVLRQGGFEVATAAEGDEALRMLANGSYDLVYLDIHLPHKDGLQVLTEIQNHDPDLPVILFTAHASLQSALDAIRLGAEDYLIKPIDPESLISRTKVLLSEQSIRRRRKEIELQITELQQELQQLDSLESVTPKTQKSTAVGEDRFIKRGGLILDLITQRATFQDQILTLPPASFDYLAAFVRHAPEVVDYETLVVEAQGYRTNRTEAQSLAKYHVHVIRKELETDPSDPQLLLNVRGVGYRLVMD
jgi:DNA-binding response OmpR family regulator